MIEIRNINQAVEVAKNYTNNELIKEILFSTFCLEQNIKSKKLENEFLGNDIDVDLNNKVILLENNEEIRVDSLLEYQEDFGSYIKEIYITDDYGNGTILLKIKGDKK